MPKKKDRPSFSRAQLTKIYPKILIGFCILAGLILAVVVYFSFSKTVISVSLNQEYATSEFDILVQPEESQEEILSLAGRVVSTQVSGEKEFTDLTTVATKEAKAEGIVTIYNNYTSQQPLMATTRLLSDEGVLFRTQELVTVPAGGSVQVNVAADLEGEKGNIPPSHFTIVALWKGMQDKIYGESTEHMTGGLKDVMVATQENINQAKNTAIDDLKQQAVTELDQQVKEENSSDALVGSAMTYEILDQEVSAEAGEEIDSFTVKTELSVSAAVFDEPALKSIALEELKSSLASYQKIDEFLDNEIEYEVTSIDSAKNSCRLKVGAKGLTTLKLSSPIFDRENLTNKDKQEIRTYFLDFDQVKHVDVKFSPFWVFRSPSLADHIEIEIIED